MYDNWYIHCLYTYILQSVVAIYILNPTAYGKYMFLVSNVFFLIGKYGFRGLLIQFNFGVKNCYCHVKACDLMETEYFFNSTKTWIIL